MHVDSASLADPCDVLPRCCALIEQGMHDGLHVGAQMYVSLRGQVVADFGIGEARPGVPMTAETIMLWLSSGKPVGAVAILQLCELGKLRLEDPVSRFIPEFAVEGKETITVWHLLTHTAGLRWLEVNWIESSWDEIIARICKVKLQRDWIPGERAAYQPFSSWYILGELVRRLDGRDYGTYVREQIFLPLGLNDCWFGMPVEQYQAYGDRVGLMVQSEKPSLFTHRYDTPGGINVCVPGGNGHGPMRQLGRFYQMLLDGGQAEGVRVLSADSVRQMTTAQRVGLFDETFKHTMDWGLGTIIDSNRYGADTVPYGYGLHSSPRAFGHGGSQSSTGFADPEHGLVATIVFNGMPGEIPHNQRMRAFLTTLYEELGLT